jgi:hypothetical protein
LLELLIYVAQMLDLLKKIHIVFFKLIGFNLGFGDLLACFPHNQVPLALVGRDVLVVFGEICYQLFFVVFFLLELGLGLKENLSDQELAVTQLANLSSWLFPVTIETGLWVESCLIATVFAVGVSTELAEHHCLFC